MDPETLLVGRSRQLERVPAAAWRHHVEAVAMSPSPRLSFMTPDHHAIRNAAVLLLPRNAGRPLSAAQLGSATRMPRARVEEVLDDLHRNLFFLVRNRHGNVSWAFPVTSDPTRHRVTFGSGERLWGA